MKQIARRADSAAAHGLPTSGLAGFAVEAQRADSLSDLSALFASFIALEGFSSHLCVVVPDGSGPSALFGDMQRCPSEALRIIRSRPEHSRIIVDGQSYGLLIPVQCWHDDLFFVLVAGKADEPDRNCIAHMLGFAEVYATYGHTLAEQQQDIATHCGLGLVQRQCLALILTGYRDFEIADMLGLAPLTVRAHVHRAMTMLETDTRAEAVAKTARQGWLVGLDHINVHES